ncbi:hypothetical protein D3C71_2146890 [compost metagenome]
MGAVERCIHGKFVGGLVVVPAAHGPFLVTQDIDHGAAFLQGFTRAGQFNLFKAVGDQEGHTLAAQLCTHC